MSDSNRPSQGRRPVEYYIHQEQVGTYNNPYAAQRPTHQVEVEESYFQATNDNQPWLQAQSFQQRIIPVNKSIPAISYKKAVRKTAMMIALALILFYVIQNITVFVMMLGDMLLGGTFTVSMLSSLDLFSNTPGFSVDTDADSNSGWFLGLMSIVAIILGSLAFFIVRGKRLVTTDLTQTSEKMRPRELLIMVCVILGIQALFTLGQIFVYGLLEYFGYSIDGGSDPFLQLMNPPGILYVVLLGPIVEEIMFRGGVMRALQPYGQNFAIVVSSLLFGVYHLIFLQSIFAFFIGLILAYCAMRFSIKWAILLHMMNNAISVALMYFNVSDNLTIAIMLMQLALGLIAVFPGFTRLSEQLRKGKPTPVSIVSKAEDGPWANVATMVRPRPYAMAFTNPLLIVGLCLAATLMFSTSFL